MEDVAVYGYITPSKTKIILAFALSDSVVRDVEVITVSPKPNLETVLNLVSQLMKAFHTTYRQSVANPFLRLHAPSDAVNDHSNSLLAGSSQWKGFRQRVDDVAKASGSVVLPAA